MQVQLSSDNQAITASPPLAWNSLTASARWNKQREGSGQSAEAFSRTERKMKSIGIRCGLGLCLSAVSVFVPERAQSQGVPGVSEKEILIGSCSAL
jgi:hypothetical protein